MRHFMKFIGELFFGIIQHSSLLKNLNSVNRKCIKIKLVSIRLAQNLFFFIRNIYLQSVLFIQ